MNRFNEQQSMYFLLCTLLQQSQRADKVIENALELINRLKEFAFENHCRILDVEESDIYKLIQKPPQLHRFPKKMSTYVYLSFQEVRECFEGKICNVFEAAYLDYSSDKLMSLLTRFYGISKHKAHIAVYVFEMYMNISKDIDKHMMEICPSISMENILREIFILDSLSEGSI